jgi:hypothetical protein
MNSLTEISKLTKYIVEPVRKNLDKKLEAYCYYDICNEDDLTTNNKGVDIISHQLELQFEGGEPIFVSWATIDGWFQYSLCVSKTSFCNGVETFARKNSGWTEIIGNPLRRFQVYGYKEHVITSTETATGMTTNHTYHNEPHLLILHFDNEKILGLANFYLETDFVPKAPMGDDLWIVFSRTYIDAYIETLSLELLDI